MQRQAAFPHLGPSPGRGIVIAGCQLLSAWALLLPATLRPFSLLPGDATVQQLAQEVNLHWVADTSGLHGLLHTRLQLWPYGIERIAWDGIPLGPLLASPLGGLGFPAAFTIWTLLVLWFAGAAVAWVAGRWWRSSGAAIVAGVTFQASGGVLIALSGGQADRVLGVSLLLLSLVLLADSSVRPDRGRGLVAGCLFGLATLTWWPFAVVGVVAAAVLIFLAWIEDIPPSGAVWFALGALAIMAFPAALVLTSTPDPYTTGAALDGSPWCDVHSLTTVLNSHAFAPADLLDRLGPRPITWALVLLTLLTTRARRWVAPSLWLLAGVVFASGAWWTFGSLLLPLPWSGLHSLPLLSRVTDPSSAMLLASAAGALLVGGGTTLIAKPPPGLHIGIAVAIALEAVLLLPQLPLSTHSWAEDPAVEAMANAKGPLLVLPTAPGHGGVWRAPLDQVRHGQPLVSGPTHLDQRPTPPSSELVLQVPGLAHLVGCETKQGRVLPAAPAQLRAALAALGVQEAWVDPQLGLEASRASDSYVACVERLLGPVSHIEGKWRVYALVDSPEQVAPLEPSARPGSNPEATSHQEVSP